jgi:phosphoglycerol transferase MdoB-like AlkP superfamily enzyme
MQYFSSLLIGGIPLIAVIFGLVEFLKVFGLKGRILTIISLLLSMAFGILYKLSLAMPFDLYSWFAVIVFGLALGLTTSGIYDFLDAHFSNNLPKG